MYTPSPLHTLDVTNRFKYTRLCDMHRIGVGHSAIHPVGPFSFLHSPFLPVSPSNPTPYPPRTSACRLMS
jgi:hypothetical protein